MKLGSLRELSTVGPLTQMLSAVAKLWLYYQYSYSGQR